MEIKKLKSKKFSVELNVRVSRFKLTTPMISLQGIVITFLTVAANHLLHWVQQI